MTPPSIEGYELGALLGAGRLGAVYQASRAPDGDVVTVRILDEEVARDHERSRAFINESLAASAVGHPGILEVLDIGQLADGRPYLVTERLEGESLAERLERTPPLSAAQAVDIVRQAAGALAAAHGEGIVHGALGARKIFLVPRPAPERGKPTSFQVKVRDFGMARLQPLGEELDERHDIQALGYLLQQALAGATRPDGPPPRLQAALLRATAPRTEEGFASMDALADALSEEGLVPALPDRPQRTGRTRVRWLATAVVVAALLSWSGFSTRGQSLLSMGRSFLHRLSAPLLGADRVSKSDPGK